MTAKNIDSVCLSVCVVEGRPGGGRGDDFEETGVGCVLFLLGFSTYFPCIKSNEIHNCVGNYVLQTLYKNTSQDLMSE